MKNPRKLLAFYGLKWNPFLPNVPIEGLWSPPGFDQYLYRVETLVMEGGFSLICGEPGLGKSKSLQLAAHHLGGLEDVVVGVMQRPQSTLSDFYREMGDIFAVNLSPANRYGGFKALRVRWGDHIRTTLFRPVLLVDEAQEVTSACLEEIRLLGSADFDSKCLLTTILCGDTRLPERFRSTKLLSLGSRIRHRLNLQPYSKETLRDYLETILEKAGSPHLMSDSLKNCLVIHAAGNLRLLNNMAADLLNEGADRELAQLEEKLFMEILSPQPTSSRKAKTRGGHS